MPIHGTKKQNTGRSWLRVLSAFLLGLYFGRGLNTPPKKGSTTASKSSFRNKRDIPFRATSHKDRASGKTIQKQQFLDPFEIPNLAGVSIATIAPGQKVDAHSHESMHELFYVLEGSANFLWCNDEEWEGATTGSFVHVVPHCHHSIVVPESSQTDLQLLVIGVTVEE